MTVVAFNGVVSSVLSWAEDQGMQLTGPMTEAINQHRSDKYHQLGNTQPSLGGHFGSSLQSYLFVYVQIQMYIVLCICHSSCDFVTLIFRGPSFGSQVINW